MFKNHEGACNLHDFLSDFINFILNEGAAFLLIVGSKYFQEGRQKAIFIKFRLVE